MLYTTTKTECRQLTKADNVNTYTANNDGLTTISESSHVVAGPKAKSRVRASKGPRTAMQKSRDRSRWLDSLENNFQQAGKGIDGLRCAYFSGHFNNETKSVQVAQNRIGKWLKDELPFKVECWTSVIEYDQYGLVHAHVVLKADKSVLNHGVNYLHNVLIKSFKTYGTGHSQRIYDLDGLGRYMMMSQTSKAKTVKQAVKDEQQAKNNYDTVKSLNVPANIKKQAKKEWRKSHMDKKKAVAKAYEKRTDKVMRKSYGQNHGVKVRCCRVDVWAFINERGQYQGSTVTRITSIDEWGVEHLINVVKRDVYRLNDSDTRVLQHMLSAIKAYQDNMEKAVA
ncbi:hypothetical protein HF864_09210 [Lactobacillus sp. MRS-253-APC-2B]|uniref:hypothetical protein n=1 Tax=Lactobacillus sp. MRS-253-APC-2B TaxID=2725305 RepID=UPI00146A461B|nr:hypothetical protein [Lactobacillus sp. MRS-253-APC-2B]NME34927.1 hypothetical protein [Lactobacillus sp. MRS-253-APC-2B]